ncbi:phosphoribosyltransferase family protein [Rhizobium sp. SG570]|uniref:phosphoribosyltransferase family protein n=1 Tax=Rhizobium sp. SG570 TaxID=2587113 RepID=UPI0014475A0C|nr:phosphoribosyltransferase family protein [Rhizobium sp. SG570]NKJ40322.1 putative HAD superfamily protein/hypoxanthine phosphoribosyltransferase [Rhizobium sp. SG570]
MQLKNYQDLQRDILQNLWKIPNDVDLIVGIPRSGILVASFIALSLNLPLVDLDGFCSGRVFETGTTRRRKNNASHYRRALIVDDSSRTGEALAKAVEKLNTASNALPPVTTCVVYGTSTIRDSVDIVMEIIDAPRIFEWNILHHPGILKDACLDIDGVLCHDPNYLENDDGPAYLDFLKHARPLYLPSHPVKALVTSRLEKYRPETEDWLRRHGIVYGRLIMLDLPNAMERRKAGVHGSHKAAYYRSSSATLFVESELHQAHDIARLSGKPVLSLEGPEMCMPNSFSPKALQQRITNMRLLARWLRGHLGDKSVDRLRAIYMRLPRVKSKSL